MIEILTKEQMADLPEKDLNSRIISARLYIQHLAKKYGYTVKQHDIVRSSASGEMGNMFVVCREYKINASMWAQVLEEMKIADKKKYDDFYRSVRAGFRIEAEASRRFWMQYAQKESKRTREKNDA